MQEHRNITLLKQLDLRNLAECSHLLADDVVFHFFQPNLPDIEGDYVGVDGFNTFFETMAARTKGTFKVQPVSVKAAGDELVVVHTQNTMTIDEQAITTDVVVVWRFVDGRIREVWDIPSAYTQASPVQPA